VGAHEGSIHTGGSSQKSGGLSVSHGPGGGDGGHPSASGLSVVVVVIEESNRVT